ncbi:MAG: PatA/PatG family cyanobactin maturation protease [Symploca sp. SIO1B1]|nr:PatA/PatG family cyanobactin maturation protease [Symploca sp. SIO1B1]
MNSHSLDTLSNRSHTFWSVLESVWAVSKGDNRICIAVLDGLMDLSHSCFKDAQITQVQTLVSGAAGRGAALQHGTHVSSIIFGQHGSPVAGIAPDCRGLIVPIFQDGPGDSIASCSQVDLARAITQAVQHGANVINISGGQLTQSGEAGHLLTKAIQYCVDNNVAIVAAAGNDGCECLNLPAAIPTVLAVGAMNDQGVPFDFSNWGKTYQTQGILAPGENILGAVPGGGTVRKSGTSFATAIISGIVGLLLSIQLKQGDKPDPQGVQAALLESANSCNPIQDEDCRRYLVGSLNLGGALASIAGKQQNQPGAIQGEARGVSEPKISEQEAGSGASELKLSEPMSDRQPESAAIQVAEAIALGRETIPERLLGNMAQTNAISNVNQQLSGLTAATVFTEAVAPTDAVTAAECATCGGATQLVYAVGTLGYDFITQARRDSIVQDGRAIMGQTWNPNQPNEMLQYFQQQPWESEAVLWTLNQEETPIYGILPNGAYAAVGFERLRALLGQQLDGSVERVSIPGYQAGSAKLLNGQVIPVIIPAIRGIYGWTTGNLVNLLYGERPNTEAEQAEYDGQVGGLANFLDRIYYELRNLGTIPQERALNYAATNALQVANVYREAAGENTNLDRIEVEKSPLCRPESDCWDVKLTFFDPSNRTERARKVYRFTVDVSDVVPVTIGRVRSWVVY